MEADSTGPGEAVTVAVLVPVYNERATVLDVVRKLAGELGNLKASGHIWVINDGSTDWDDDIAEALKASGPVSVVTRPVNAGKGAVLGWAFRHVEARYMVIIDADGEYLPSEIPAVLNPLLNQEADWVMGARYGFGRPRPRQYMATYWVNRLLSAWFNLLAGRRLTADLLTGLYACRAECVRNVVLQEHRFAYTPELMWNVLRGARPRWLEVPVTYRFRSYAEGKTIRWWETFTIFAATLRYRFVRVKGAP